MNTFTIESEEAVLWLRPGTAVKSIYGFSLIPKRIANLESIGVSVEEPVEVVAQSPVGDIVSYRKGSRKATFRVLDIDDAMNATLVILKDSDRLFGGAGDVVCMDLNSLEHEPVMRP